MHIYIYRYVERCHMRDITNALMRACVIDELSCTEVFNMPKDPCYIVSVLLSPGVIFPLHYSGCPKHSSLYMCSIPCTIQSNGGMSKHPWRGQSSLWTCSQREDYPHLGNHISSNSATFVPNCLCTHLFQEKIESSGHQKWVCALKMKCSWPSTVLAKYNILPPMASCPNLSPLNIPQELTATVKCIGGCFSEVLYLYYIYSMKMTLASDGGGSVLRN